MTACDPLSINGIQEVSGSIPLISTNEKDRLCACLFSLVQTGSYTADLLHINQIRLRRLSGVYRRKGQRFDPAYLHHKSSEIVKISELFLFYPSKYSSYLL